MDKFWTLLRESVITQGLVTLFLIVTVCYLYATQKPVPTDLLNLTSLVIGFYFGAKVQSLVHKSEG